MIICHIAPFAPSRCGLYESARDMAKADVLAGHQVIFIDTGVVSNGIYENPIIGGVDDRANFKLETTSPSMVDSADIIILHSGCPDAWLVSNQTPLIWCVHGRPKASFIPNNGASYDLYKTLSGWKRTKYMLYFWKEFIPHWNFCFNGKDLCLDYPVIDEQRFSQEGEKYNIINLGQKNILICDSDREDIGLYDLMIGLIETAKQLKGFKFHFVGCFDIPVNSRYQFLLDRLNKLGALGDVLGRVTNLETVYRSMDCLISPNIIAVRTIAEALTCKIPVIAQVGCKIADICVNFNDPFDVVDGFDLFLKEEKFDDKSNLFSMKNYSEKMEPIYKELVK